MTQTSKKENTLVILIGASKYDDDKEISPIPNIKQYISQLVDVLTDKNIGAIPKKNICILLDKPKSIIQRRLVDISRRAKDYTYTLIVYYAGHGILSSEDFKLYLTTSDTNREYVETDGISIDLFQKIIAKSRADRKIVILDACHSGQIHNTMGDLPSQIQVELEKFEGTYVMTSASEDSPSLFPHKNSNEPTYFTGKIIDILKNGIENNKKYFSIRDIFDEIESDFRNSKKYPIPQQSIFKSADKIIIAKNKKYNNILAEQDMWISVSKINTIEAYNGFIKIYNESKYVVNAKQKIYELSELILWQNIKEERHLHNVYEYIEKYPKGKYVKQAEQIIVELEELSKWEEATHVDSYLKYRAYLNSYPKGIFVDEANEKVKRLKYKYSESRLWKETLLKNKTESYLKYIEEFPNGNYLAQAQRNIELINKKVKVKHKLASKKLVKKYSSYFLEIPSYLRQKNKYIIIKFIIVSLIAISIFASLYYFYINTSENKLAKKITYSVIKLNTNKKIQTKTIRTKISKPDLNLNQINKFKLLMDKGNSFLKKGEANKNKKALFLEKSLSFYKQALHLNIGNKKANFNIVLVKRMLYLEYKRKAMSFLNADKSEIGIKYAEKYLNKALEYKNDKELREILYKLKK